METYWSDLKKLNRPDPYSMEDFDFLEGRYPRFVAGTGLPDTANVSSTEAKRVDARMLG